MINRFTFLLLTIIALWSATAAADTAATLPDGPLFMGYYESWSEWPVATAKATRLANLPDYLNIVAIGFVRPDLKYDGGNDLSGTGLQVPFDAALLAEAIHVLKARNPHMRVVLSVGGSAYAGGWPGFVPEALARLVKALDVDGIDLDYEPSFTQCGRQGDEPAGVTCASDQKWADYNP